jgi:hypothetical protein
MTPSNDKVVRVKITNPRRKALGFSHGDIRRVVMLL